jgi:hypothetical protein
MEHWNNGFWGIEGMGYLSRALGLELEAEGL